MASSPRYPAGACAGAAPDWLCDGKLTSITQLVLCGGNLAACLQTELNAAKDTTRTSPGLGRPCPAPGREWGSDLYLSRP